jgi:predicted amidohydrolase
MFTTGFTMNPGHIAPEEGERTLEWMQQQAERTDAGVVGSMVFQENGQYFNRLIFMQPGGVFDSYDKRHTFTLAGEDRVYQRGTERTIIQFRDFTFCPLICYDLRFPVWSRNTMDYDVLLYVANWPSPRIGAWDTLLRARSIENMAYTLGVNRIGSDPNGLTYNGHSAGFDGMGNRLAYSEREEVLQVTLSKAHLEESRNTFRFLDDRDHFTLKP